MQNGSTISEGLSQRPAGAADRDFLRRLFAESRPELALLPDEVRGPLIDLQFDSQLIQYRRSAPDAVDWILLADHDGGTEPVGRCYLSEGVEAHRLLDLVIRQQWRGRGLGRLVLERLQDGAARAGVPLRLSVWHDNLDALRLYRRLGFVTDDGCGDSTGGPAGYLRLRWSAGGPA